MRRDEPAAKPVAPCPACGGPGGHGRIWQLHGLCVACVRDWFDRPEHESGRVIPDDPPHEVQCQRFEKVTGVWLAKRKTQTRKAAP